MDRSRIKIKYRRRAQTEIKVKGTQIPQHDAAATSSHSQRENDPAQPRAEDDLYRPPILPGESVQIASKSDAWQEIGEEDVDGAGEDQLIEDGPVRDISSGQIAHVLAEEAERLQRPSEGGACLHPCAARPSEGAAILVVSWNAAAVADGLGRWDGHVRMASEDLVVSCIPADWH